MEIFLAFSGDDDGAGGPLIDNDNDVVVDRLVTWLLTWSLIK